MKVFKNLYTFLALGMFTCLHVDAFSQQVMPIYPNGIPNAKPVPDAEQSSINKDSILIISQVTRPTLSIYLPLKEKSTGAAVIICPGGGYQILAAGHEGADVAKRFTEMGIAAFVLKYRLPSDQTMINKEIGPLQDAQRAIQLVRQNATTWGIDPSRVGIMGFSAGGHLASTAGTRFQTAYIHNPQKTNLRPDFMILVYPVISFTDSIGHTGSRNNLIGKNPRPEKIKQFSSDQQVTEQTPPTFLVHAKDDPVKVENTLRFEAALKSKGVPVAMHLYEQGGHGYGMINKTSPVRWMDLVEQWMQQMGFLKSARPGK